MNCLNRSMLVAAAAAGVSVGVLGMARAGEMNLGQRAIRLDDHDHDRNPHLHNSLLHLRAAREELQAADPGFGHHRDDAIEHTDKAIKIVEDAVRVGDRSVVRTPTPTRLDDDMKHVHMHKALDELHEAYKELDSAEPVFDRDRREEATNEVEKAIHDVREGLKDAEK